VVFDDEHAEFVSFYSVINRVRESAHRKASEVRLDKGETIWIGEDS